MASICYAFGWRKQLPDHRDLMYKVPAHIAASLPSKVDLDTPSPGMIFDPAGGTDQGALGACGPNTTAENISFDELRDNPAGAVLASRLFIYYNTRYLMGTLTSDSGVDNRTMLKALNQFGWCDEALWPYNISQFTVKPPQPCFTQAATRIATLKYEAVTQDLGTMKGCLAADKPFIFGFTVYSSMLTPQVQATGMVPMPTMLDQVQGGHDVLICGYDDATQMFKFKNHWTSSWGQSGYGFIPYEYAINPNLSGDFWTVDRVGDAAPVPPTPGPGPSPTPTPTPIPPPAPSSLQKQVDQIFDFIISVVTNQTLKDVLGTVKQLVDDYIQSHNMLTAAASKSQLQAIIDNIFADLEKEAAGQLTTVLALQLANRWIDKWLAEHGI